MFLIFKTNFSSKYVFNIKILLNLQKYFPSNHWAQFLGPKKNKNKNQKTFTKTHKQLIPQKYSFQTQSLITLHLSNRTWHLKACWRNPWELEPEREWKLSLSGQRIKTGRSIFNQQKVRNKTNATRRKDNFFTAKLTSENCEPRWVVSIPLVLL